MFTLIMLEYTKPIYDTFRDKPREENESLSDAQYTIAYNKWYRNVFMNTVRSEAINWLDNNMKKYTIKNIETDDDENICIYLK